MAGCFGQGTGKKATLTAIGEMLVSFLLFSLGQFLLVVALIVPAKLSREVG
jgi:hypothetical protein